MNTDEINNVINRFVSNKLSPTMRQRDYISSKYAELCEFLKNNCFQSGSYARFTAGNPVHDVDVIYTVSDSSIQHDPAKIIGYITSELQAAYKLSKITRVKRIYGQTHSVTIEFADSPEEFSMDVVPAIILPRELNQFGQPIYLVPEIIRMNRHDRIRRYEAALQKPITWIKSDPRGYVQAATELNTINPEFRHTAKLIKTWRYACKDEYEDNFCLKSFHLELIVYEYFMRNSGTHTLDALIFTLGALPGSIAYPQMPDRADASRKVDDYVTDLTTEQKRLIISEQSKALTIVRSLPFSDGDQDVADKIQAMLAVRSVKQFNTMASSVRVINPQQPWSQ